MSLKACSVGKSEDPWGSLSATWLWQVKPLRELGVLHMVDDVDGWFVLKINHQRSTIKNSERNQKPIVHVDRSWTMLCRFLKQAESWNLWLCQQTSWSSLDLDVLAPVLPLQKKDHQVEINKTKKLINMHNIIYIYIYIHNTTFVFTTGMLNKIKTTTILAVYDLIPVEASVSPSGEVSSCWNSDGLSTSWCVEDRLCKGLWRKDLNDNQSTYLGKRTVARVQDVHSQDTNNIIRVFNKLLMRNNWA